MQPFLLLVGCTLAGEGTAASQARAAAEAQGVKVETVTRTEGGAYEVRGVDRDGRVCTVLVGAHEGSGTSMAAAECAAGAPGDPGYEARAIAACDAGSTDACARLGALYGGDPARVALAPVRLERACELGSRESCHNRGVLMNTGQGGPADHVGALGWFERACAQGFGAACFEYGLVVVRHPDTGKSAADVATMARKGCEVDHGLSCALWAQMVLSGQAFPEQSAAARESASRACAAGEKDACGVLGQFPAH